MGVTYFLTCMQCKTGLNLGKAVKTHYDGVPKQTYGFDALGHSSQGPYTPSIPHLELLQHFLMLHRTHELRVLPDTVAKYVTDIGFPQSFPELDRRWPESRVNFLEIDVGTPDPEREVDELAPDVVKVLRSF